MDFDARPTIRVSLANLHRCFIDFGSEIVHIVMQHRTAQASFFPCIIPSHHAPVIVPLHRASAEGTLTKDLRLDNITAVCRLCMATKYARYFHTNVINLKPTT